jgi:hypothetical protein
MKYLFRLLVFTLLISCQENQKSGIEKKSEKPEIKTLEVLLVGTFHFANFYPENNGDLVQKKIRDVLTDENQTELENIALKIAEFNPDKIFVEESYKRQEKLDSIFSSFPISTDYKTAKRQETYQLAFRVAKKLNHKKVYAIDLRTDFPYDSLLTEMKKAKQFELIKKDEFELEKLEKSANELFSSDKTLSEIIFHYNQDKYRKDDINWYLSLANQGGERTNFVGSYLTSEWYRRNLHMYSIIQKSIKNKDKKIMILGGSSHIAMFKDFINYNPEWKTVELKEIMER